MKVAHILLLVTCALCDFFLHNPRGSNNRLNEANQNRNNANRLFDSQNNAKGGYCYGPAMSYYEGSYLQVEYDGTHGTKNPRLQSNVVLQYLCSASDADPTVLVRDGTTTDTVPNDANGPTAKDDSGEIKFGMHEPRDWYVACQTRERNKGLWIADRANPNIGNLNGDSAVVTRQNNNGGRRGYECPEERDYYPYWHPAPWKDIAVITDNTQFCPFYQSASQNVQAKGECVNITGSSPAPQNNEANCTAAGNLWRLVPSWGIAAPDCVSTSFARSNSAGFTLTGKLGAYLWKLPNSTQEPCIATNNCNCVMRARYNVTSADTGPGGFNPETNFVDWTLNGARSPIKNRNQDPSWSTQDGNIFQLATDTSQFGRVFQDRSHVFHIKPRPVDSQARIYNLNVKGKRGNTVQAYPALEYGFVPDDLAVGVGDYIHFQWTGCDTNPAENAGEGTYQTDRSNIVQIQTLDKDTPALVSWIDGAPGRALFPDVAIRNRFANLDQTDCLTYQQLLDKNANNQNNVENDVQNCMKLNAASSYFDGGLVRMNTTGQFFFMSTRNNNPSNRLQKGTIQVVPVGTPTGPTGDPSSAGSATVNPSSATGEPSSEDVSSAISLLCGFFTIIGALLYTF